MMTFQSILFVKTLLLVHVVIGDEPQCSKFDFEEKLLEKVVRMEFQMNRLTSEMSQAVEEILSSKNTVETTLKALDSERDKLASDTTAKITALQQRVENELGKKIEEIRTVTDRTLGTMLLFRVVQTQRMIYMKTGDILVLSEVLFNAGAYDPSTGVFTATTNGTYVFTVRLYMYNKEYVKPAVMVDGSEQDVFTFYVVEGNPCSTAETIVVLKEGQKVWLQIQYAGSSVGIYGDKTRWSTFTGRIL